MIALLLAVAIQLPTIPGVYQGPGCEGHPVRPPSSYTTALKIRQIRKLGYADTDPSHYEEDHLVQLSLGGQPRSSAEPGDADFVSSNRNLWPQPWDQARRDDRIEYDLYRRACLHIGRPLAIKEAVRWERRWKRRHG